MILDRDKTITTLQQAKPIIAPSMLKCDFANMHREIELLEQADARVLHWDIMDGNFVPNLSYGAMLIEKVRPLTNLVFDAHLMIANPEQYWESYIKAGCDCITFHIEAVPNPNELLKKIQNAGAVAGLVINPGTSIQTIEPYLENCDMVLVMSVEPGFGGQKFMPVCLEKLAWLKEQLTEQAGANAIIAIDGGIAEETIAQTADAGANLFVCGSSIFDKECYKEAVSSLRHRAMKACCS